MKIVHNDYGHGGKDPGAIGNGLREKDITLSIGKKATNILRQHGVKVTESRTNDKYLSLTERANMSNKNNADILVSFHVNSAINVSARGFEIWTSRGQTQGDVLATAIGEQIQKDFPDVPFRADYSDSDLDKEANFTVIYKAKAPACLIEMGFIKNVQDAQMLKTQRDKIAQSIANGILNYLGIKYKGVDKVDKNEPSKWAEKEWKWAEKEGYLDGSRPKEPITREEMAIVLKRLVDRIG